MALTGGKIEDGTTTIGGSEYPISSVLTQQKGRFIDTPQGQRVGNVNEVLMADGSHKGIIELDGQVIEGEVSERRRKFGNMPHRQKIVSTSGFEVVISSDEIR